MEQASGDGSKEKLLWENSLLHPTLAQASAHNLTTNEAVNS